MERENRSVLFKEVRAALRSKESTTDDLIALLNQLPRDSDKAQGLRAKIRNRVGIM